MQPTPVLRSPSVRRPPSTPCRIYDKRAQLRATVGRHYARPTLPDARFPRDQERIHLPPLMDSYNDDLLRQPPMPHTTVRERDRL